MPQDPSREADTVRLNPDGTVGRGRHVPPPATADPERATGAAATPDQPVAAPPAGAADDAAAEPAPTSSDTQVITPVDDTPATEAPARPEASDTQLIAPGDDTPATDEAPARPDASDTQVITPVDDTPATDEAPARPDASDTQLIAPAPVPPSGHPWWRRRSVFLPAAAVLALGAAAYGADLLTAGGDVPRGTLVAGVDLGGLSPAAAAQRLEDELAPRVVADRTLVADDVQAVLHPPAAGIALDVPGTVDAVADQPLNPWTRVSSLFTDRKVDPVLVVDQTSLTAQIEQFATTVDRAPVDATITIDGTTPQVIEPVEGRTLDRAASADAVTAALASSAEPSSPVELPVEVTAVRVESPEAHRVLDEIVTPALAAPVAVAGTDGSRSVELPVTAIAASLAFTPGDDGTLAVAVDPAALQDAMGEAFTAFGSPAQDARFEVSGDTISIVPSVDGQGIDPADLAADLLTVLDDPAPRSVTAALGPLPAAFTTAQAEALRITERVSSFTTNFTNAASGTNIRVVAAEVDGAVVEPGDTFSLNGHTGPRGTAQGYVPAAVISGGELSQAVGGGISQFATTMFNAVFFAGLEDVYHKPHSFYISRYPAGREATVYEGSIDLQWRNDTDTGIYVQTEWVPGALTVTFWGTKHYDIESISSERRNIRQPAVQEKVDDGNCTPQSGSTGFDITVTRVFKDPETGAELRRENFNTHYAAEAIIRCIPPAAPPADAPADPAGEPAVGGPPAPASSTGRRPEARAGADVRIRVRRRHP